MDGLVGEGVVMGHPVLVVDDEKEEEEEDGLHSVD